MKTPQETYWTTVVIGVPLLVLFTISGMPWWLSLPVGVVLAAPVWAPRLRATRPLPQPALDSLVVHDYRFVARDFQDPRPWTAINVGDRPPPHSSLGENGVVTQATIDAFAQWLADHAAAMVSKAAMAEGDDPVIERAKNACEQMRSPERPMLVRIRVYP